MKKATALSALLLVLGFLFEWFYLNTDSTFLGIKLHLLGAFCIIFGAIGLWIYAIMPFINNKMDK